MKVNFKPSRAAAVQFKKSEYGSGHAAPRRSLSTRPPNPKYLQGYTDLSPLRNRRVFCICDDENLRLGALQHGRRFSYGLLLDRLMKVTESVCPVAVITSPEWNNKREEYLKSRGWKPVVLPREKCNLRNGSKLYTNVDADLAAEVGFALADKQFETLLIASGDGMLCRTCAHAARRHRPDVRIVTIALPGTASSDLWARRDLFHNHIPLGLDLTRPAGAVASFKEGGTAHEH